MYLVTVQLSLLIVIVLGLTAGKAHRLNFKCDSEKQEIDRRKKAAIF